MQVNDQAFGKLLEGSQIHQIGHVKLRVPGMPGLIALKLHAMRSNAARLDKDGRDITGLLMQDPGIPGKPALETMTAK